MSGRRRYRRPPNHGKHRKRRPGTHKGSRSPETVRWNEEHLIPKRPPWMPPATYTALADLRARL